MKMKELRNAWGRGPDGAERATATPSLADDRKTKFDRNDDRRNAERGNTAVHDANVKRIADENARWVHKTALRDPETERLRAASDASRTAPTAAPISINVETLAALVRDWKANGPSGKNFLALFEQNEWNREQLNQATQYLIKKGHLINARLPEDAFLLCYNGNHLDPQQRRDRAGNVVHLRGEAGRPAPVPFPRTIWADEAAAIEREQQEKALAVAAVETARAKSLPFDELKKVATKDRKAVSPEMGPIISVGN